jgi:hypothetical protein
MGYFQEDIQRRIDEKNQHYNEIIAFSLQLQQAMGLTKNDIANAEKYDLSWTFGDYVVSAEECFFIGVGLGRYLVLSYYADGVLKSTVDDRLPDMMVRNKILKEISLKMERPWVDRRKHT